MRQQGQYGDPSPNTYVAAKMHNIAGQGMETKSGNFEGRLEAFTPERENTCSNSKPEGQWRWELDGSNMSNSMALRVYNEGQGRDASRSYFQGQRQDPKLVLQNQSNNDARSLAQDEDMDVEYEGNHISQTFEGLEQKFLDDIMKLVKEQNDAEDAENARHRERIHAISAQYEEKLAALRARHASCRDEFLQRESHARQQQYQQSIRDTYPRSGGMPPSDPHGYNANNAAGAVEDVQRGYNAGHFDPYRERARFLGGASDQGFEPTRGSYPGGRVYDTGSRYYN